ncbi:MULTISPECIES: N-acetylmuramidase family protein [unclassified Spirosoma]|mgnify:CR=1 FL=1|uniref:N-acetylmuramidase family protein n=1 Tax=unclassified Spirosoma TaxID=2621999 RepID=UPI00095A633D|nr:MULTISPECIES: N-acetylmuramidase family protein [unclassified Spirosoma]MBN8825086.1 N-acetylmuramidase family protein [Spirosoma sp.]OJW77220.1 MAG: hypothetical protein BGO59_31705 [Spirosoma sp. 48-14]
MSTKLQPNDYESAAKRLGTGIAEVKAVCEVESGGTGFTADGKCIIRFEPHIFSRYTKGQYDVSHPTLSFPVRRAGYPTSVEHSWKLFEQAAKLNANAAVLACSWGLFQVMAFNYSACGCKSLNEFVARMERSEGDQLDMFCTLLINWGLNDELARHEWATFARVYNGPDYKSNLYDMKLDKAYRKYSVN